MSWFLDVGELLLLLAGMAIGCFVGWGLCLDRYEALAARLVLERAQVDAEHEVVRAYVSGVEKAASEAIDTIDVMQGLAQVEALLAKRGAVR